MYSIDITPELDGRLKKLYKRDRKKHEIVMRKVEEIIKDPHHYKNLRSPLQRLKRVHIDGSFVLVFSVNESTKTVLLKTLTITTISTLINPAQYALFAPLLACLL